ncbi:MAG TPA: hypothetical protein VL096_21715 [Pirellulaceae bacterium]|nr:hypothetical protein [Pirellulaceae bacterium]
MTSYPPRRAALVIIVWLLCLAVLPWGGSRVASAANAEPKLVQVELKITDEDSGLTAHIKCKVPAGTSGLEAVQRLVPLKVREYPGLGPRVLKICDVEPKRGKYWGLSVDGKVSEVGIASVKVENDILIEWNTKE